MASRFQLPASWRPTIHAAVRDVLRPTARPRIVGAVVQRLSVHGFAPTANNFGGVLCGLPHRHSDGRCVVVAGRPLQRFDTPEAGMRRLVELCCVAQGQSAALAGFRSELRPGDDDAGGLFGPDEKAERTFQELSAEWTALEKEPGVEKLRKGLARDSYSAWVAFRDKWRAGDADTASLAPMVADLNQTKENLGKERSTIRPTDVTQTTALLQAAQAGHEGDYVQALDKAWSGAKASVKETLRELPAWKMAAGGGAAGVLVTSLLLLFRR